MFMAGVRLFSAVTSVLWELEVTFLLYLDSYLGRPNCKAAVYISTFALVKLPAPLNTTNPTDQVDILSATMQPIVAFVVLVSILIRMLISRIVTETRRLIICRRTLHPFLQSRKTSSRPHSNIDTNVDIFSSHLDGQFWSRVDPGDS
jgi:hypothetical protein